MAAQKLKIKNSALEYAMRDSMDSLEELFLDSLFSMHHGQLEILSIHAPELETKEPGYRCSQAL